MYRLQHDAPPCVQKLVPGAKDNWLILDSSELHSTADGIPAHLRQKVDNNRDWHGGSFDAALEMCRTGDMSVVEKSDALLSEMSAYMPQSARRGYHMDVAGAVPSVPVYLSGNPLNMRRRIKTRDEYAPIAIVYDPTCSAAISNDKIFRRGIVVLALVRALAGLRPIELWTCGGLNVGRTGGGYVAIRIETAPLDLARAAHLMTSTMAVRGINYNLLNHYLGCDGGWPYCNHSASLGTNFREVVRAAMPHVSDVLAIPAIHCDDELLTDPKAWLRRTFLELTGQDQQEAA